MPVSKIIDTRSMRLTGHILRMDKDTLPQIAMKSYFNPSQKNSPWAPTTNLGDSTVITAI